MKNTKYLYGDDIPPAIPQHIIDKRIEILTNRLEKALNHSFYNRDQQLVKDLFDAIKFWENINEK
jgi:hypothetical protein